ncbi:hypothetical protein R6Q59_011445 [Mikania micrantha]
MPPCCNSCHLHAPLPQITGDYAMLREWWNNDLIIDGTTESDLMPELAQREEEIVVEKNTYSGFRGTGLEERLKEMGVEEVIVTVVMTNLCFETTAREAFVRGFRLFFSTDATSSEDLHLPTLKNMAYGFAYLVDCKSLQHALCVFNLLRNICHVVHLVESPPLNKTTRFLFLLSLVLPPFFVFS